MWWKQKWKINSPLIIYRIWTVILKVTYGIKFAETSLLICLDSSVTATSSIHCFTSFLIMSSYSRSLLRACLVSSLSLVLQPVSAFVGSATVSSTVLVIARDATSALNSASLGLQGYGIPYETLVVPQAGITNLPLLNASATNGNYGGIVVVGEVSYNYDNSYRSALTTDQWNQLYAYQTNFGVRMVRLDVFPTTEFGVVSTGGSLDDQPVTFTNTSGFPSANLKT